MAVTADFTLDSALRALSTSRPDQIAWSCAGRSATSAELDRRTDQVAHGLRAAGVGPGDRVIFIGKNRGELFEILFGCSRLGAVFTPLNWRLPPAQATELIVDSAARIAFAEAAFSAAVPSGVRTIEFTGPYENWRSHQDDGTFGSAPHGDDICIQFYTSGTTGQPRGVEISHRNLGYLMRAGMQWRLGTGHIAAAAMPFFHMGGSAWGLVTILAGGQCVVFPEFDPASYLDAIERHRITNLLLAPSMLQMLLDVPDIGDRDLSSVRGIVYGSAPITQPLLRAVRATLDVPLLQVYGLTETCGGVVQLEPDDHTGELLASAGRPYPWVQLSVRDPAGAEVPPGITGEVWIRSPQCSRGYWRLPAESARLRTADGWLRTGDAGHLSGDGYLYLTDRIKDMIITGGENVYPAQVERILIEHPDLAEVAVFGVPHRIWGEAVVAAVVPLPGRRPNPADLVDWMRPRLAGYMRPQRVRVLSALPRNPAGKILKYVLRESISPDLPH